ncbi:MAG: DUF1059 domain-containing protein [Nitrosopumilaceae archaeon]
MAKLRCKDYGYDCDFEAVGEDLQKVMEVFGNLTSLAHGVKHEKESLMQFITGATVSCPYCNSKFDSKEQLSTHIDRVHHGSGILEGDTRNL